MRSRRLLFIAACLLVGVVLFEGARRLAHQRMHLQGLQRSAAALRAELTAQRQKRKDAQQELALAEHQLAELPAADLPGDERERRAAIQEWLARLKRLKHFFDGHPDQCIPEMRYLTEEDWLHAAKDAELDSDEGFREALAAARSAAKSRFQARLGSAIRKFIQVNRGEVPTNILALAPYLEDVADATILDRYAIQTAGLPTRNGAQMWATEEKAPIDADYDFRYLANSGGGGGVMSPPLAWIPDYRARSTQAYRDYETANKGRSPESIDDVLPLFNPPLDAALIERIVKAQRKRDGGR
jgi:hypothetical protein